MVIIGLSGIGYGIAGVYVPLTQVELSSVEHTLGVVMMAAFVSEVW
jgi:hypothetical protein